MRTEDVSPRYRELDLWPAADLVDAVVEQQLAAVAAVRAARAQLAAAVDAAVAVLEGGRGRIVYVGAGSSGRLAVQDGVELPPTYGWPHERLVYFMAGGEAALVRSVEGAEDDAPALRRAFAERGIGADDVIVTVAASGTTPYALAAVDAGRAAGAITIALANNTPSLLLETASHPVALVTGGEVVAGSTRMAAGTAQKAALNALSTAIMVRLGHTYGNLMVDLDASNVKLELRRIAMLQRIVAVDETTARSALEAAGGHVKTAVLIAAGDDPATAKARLARARGRLREALGAR